jgi:hypothetical protein
MVLVAACGGDGGSGGDCAFAVELAGAITASFTESDPASCSAANDLGGDPIIVFVPEHATLMRFELELEADQIGMTGPGIAGGLSIITKSGAVWSTDCTYDLARWDGTDRDQRLEGSGSCPDPAEPDTGTMTITVANLRFDMQ